MRRALLSTVVTCLLAVGVAGCGEPDKGEYERELVSVGRTIDEALADLPTDGVEVLGPDHVARLSTDLKAAADELEGLDPPEDVRPAQDRLERGMRSVARSFDRLARDLRSATEDDAKAELFVEFATDEEVDEGFDDLIGAQEAYAQEGYRVFGTSTGD